MDCTHRSRYLEQLYTGTIADISGIKIILCWPAGLKPAAFRHNGFIAKPVVFQLFESLVVDSEIVERHADKIPSPCQRGIFGILPSNE